MSESFLLFIAFVSIPFLWAWIYRKKKPKSAKLVRRIATAIVLAIIFLWISILTLFITFWEGGRRYSERDTVGMPFYIINYSSVSLQLSANLAYTPQELINLNEQGIHIEPTLNFTTYNMFIPHSDTLYKSRYELILPIPEYRPDVAWPSKLTIILSDTLGNVLKELHIQDIDSTMRSDIQLKITNSMLQSIHKEQEVMHKNKKKGGGKL